MNESAIEKIRAWREAYLKASPEEQARMLAEKKESRRKAEEEEQKRIYAEQKKRFTDRAKSQIAILKSLVVARKIALDAIKQFDGKVLNNRLTKIVEPELKKFDKHLYASLVVSYDSMLKGNVGTLKIECYHQMSGERNHFSIRISLSPLSDGNRVIYADTLSDKNNEEESLTVLIASWQNAIKTYDKSYKFAVKLKEMIDKYGKEVNFELRNHFKCCYIISNTYYL